MNNLYASLESQYGLPEGALSAIEGTERSGDTAVSPKGAKGRFQFMPETAKAYGVDTADPVSSAVGAAKFLSDLQNQYGSFKAAVAHYNGGTKAAKAVLAGNEPPATETKNYLTSVDSKMPINAEQVQWDSDPIDASKIQWESEPKTEEKQGNAELFGKGLKASLQTTMTGIGQKLDPLAQQLEKSFEKVEKATGGTLPGKLAKQIQEYFNLPTAQEVAANREAEILAQRQANEKILSTPAGLAGNITGEMAQALALPGGTIGKAALSGAEMGAIQPTLKDESTAFNILSGAGVGAAGQGIVNALGRVAQPVANQLGDIAQNAVDTLRKAGVPLDAAQTTGSALLGRVKAALSDNPITVGAQQEFSGAQKQAFNKAISKTMGEDATHITPDIIQSAKDRIGNVYEDVASRVNIQTDKPFINSLNQINDDALHTLEESQYKVIKKNIDDIVSKSEKNNGYIDATQYKNLKMP